MLGLANPIRLVTWPQATSSLNPFPLCPAEPIEILQESVQVHSTVLVTNKPPKWQQAKGEGLRRPDPGF